MKYILSLVICILVVGIVTFIIRASTSNPTSSEQPSPSTSVHTYSLIVISDSVSVVHANATTSQNIQGSTTVTQGDTITTSMTGRARLRWTDDTITTLEPNTTITIEQLTGDGTQSRLTLIVGDMWAKVGRILGVGQYYEVQTQETVAAVRGTIFRVSYHNRRTRVQGIENTVRVFVRDEKGNTDESTGIDVRESSIAELDASTTATVKDRRLESRRLTATELRDPILEQIKREKNLDDNQIIEQTSPTPSLTTTPTRTPTPTSIKVSPSLLPSPLPTKLVTPTPTPVETPQPEAGQPLAETPTPLPPVQIDHVFPSVISPGDTFSLEGFNYTSGRNTSRISSISVGGQSAKYSIVGSTSIFVTPFGLTSGVYDISVVTTDGVTLTIKNAITIK